ncbi:MAG: hypothetical protein KF718_03290 [Polyangiaceae bacterium]|nr:hypothetical protein [Polyangiaceae bacterium]
MLYGGAAIYALGGPTVHAWRDHWGKAAGSLGLRAGAPLTFATVALGSPENWDGGAVITLVVLSLFVGAFDAAALAWEPAPDTALPWQPRVLIRESRLGLEVVGAF